MEHITNVLVYSNRCEVLDSHVFTVGDKGFPHIRIKFIYMFGAETLQGKQLELKYILPDKSYQVETISVTGENEVLFPIHYSVFVNGGWTTLKITIVEGANRITLDDIIIKTKKLEAEQEFQHKDVKAIVQTEITKISKKIKEFEEETKTELNTLKSNLSQNLETEKNSNIEALKEAYNNEIKKLDGDVEKVVTKYLKENTDTFNGEIAKLTDALNGKENSFDKNTAFNKNFGTTADTVLEGNKLDEINEKFKTVNNEIDAKFRGVAGGKVNLNFIQDPGEKIEGEYYLDKTSGKLHRCIKRTSSTVNSNEYFEDVSINSIMNKFESLKRTQKLLWRGASNDLPFYITNASPHLTFDNVHSITVIGNVTCTLPNAILKSLPINEELILGLDNGVRSDGVFYFKKLSNIYGIFGTKGIAEDIGYAGYNTLIIEY
ncbi:hypothetical protein CTN00_01870 [Fusobacterium pseudoperiodonticum]|uniref:hypothetical protein n=1 Tax=Fusobacterium pseudoperiodonticum TaxID=2663009 RepID=UPI000C1B81F8|nr:hypothetical protein [Fusobacterium pseudoperiodonticum]ATV71832.1 hypothetical protein CTN00_01870 [Fusobacterium pseudoperiodonticum]